MSNSGASIHPEGSVSTNGAQLAYLLRRRAEQRAALLAERATENLSVVLPLTPAERAVSHPLSLTFPIVPLTTALEGWVHPQSSLWLNLVGLPGKDYSDPFVVPHLEVLPEDEAGAVRRRIIRACVITCVGTLLVAAMIVVLVSHLAPQLWQPISVLLCGVLAAPPAVLATPAGEQLRKAALAKLDEAMARELATDALQVLWLTLHRAHWTRISTLEADIAALDRAIAVHPADDIARIEAGLTRVTEEDL